MDGPSTFTHAPLFRIGMSGEEAEATDKVCNCMNTHLGTQCIYNNEWNCTN